MTRTSPQLHPTPAVGCAWCRVCVVAACCVRVSLRISDDRLRRVCGAVKCSA